MKILITGGAGYIGSKLVPRLLEHNHGVRILDSNEVGRDYPLFHKPNANIEFMPGDIRYQDIINKSLDGIDGVVHLAAAVIVSGSESDAQARLINQINHEATCNFAHSCRDRGVERFVFTSTCSNYGKRDMAKSATENDPLDPTSPYAIAKVKAERCILDLTGASFHPTVLRLATVFGMSPRMNYNPMLNQFVKEAVISKSLLIFGAHTWRPFVHIDDVVSAVILVLDAPLPLVSGEVFNVGADNLNCQKVELANLIRKHLPETAVQMRGSKLDPRDYKVSFEKVARVLGFRVTKGLEDGIREMKEELQRGS